MDLVRSRMRRSGRAGAGLLALVCVAVLACGARTPLEVDVRRDGASAADDGGTLDASVPDAGFDSGDATIADALDEGTGDDAGDSSFPEHDAAPPVLAAPRLISPLSTSTVTLAAPTLSWQLAPGEDGAQIDLCSEPACATVVTTFTVKGASGHTPGLDRGLWYWRARGVAGMRVGAAISPVWEFVVRGSHPQNPAVADTSWGTILDVNGDGHPEILVGAQGDANDVGAAYLYQGGAGGPSSTPVTIPNPSGMPEGLFGSSAASAGDVDGDGLADMIIGARGIFGGGRPIGQTFVFRGGPAGAITTLTDPADINTSEFGYSVASAGDVDRDGYADVVVGAPAGGTAACVAYLYRGGPGGIEPTPLPLTVAGSKQLGISVAGAGDVNGDGYGDVVVGANMTGPSGVGAAYLFMGGPAGLSTTPVVLVPSGLANTFGFGFSVASAGDVDGDGYADVVVGANSSNGLHGAVFVFHGSSGGIDPTPQLLGAPSVSEAELGWAVAGVGDVDGDGFDDVVAGAPGNGLPGIAVLWVGAPPGTAVAPLVFATDAVAFGAAVSGAGDLDGDDLDDVLVGEPGAPGRVGVFLGRTGGSLFQSGWLTDTTPNAYQFGFSVARRLRGVRRVR